MEKQKRVVAVHDISCFGKCSLTVALPVISAAGIETVALPTAVLSTHTGGISGYTYRDLTNDVQPIADHWKSLGLQFDAIYTGYLGSFEQLKLVENLFDTFAKDDCLVAVDPVMADYGKLYPGFADDFPKGMAHLCSKADLVIPNITEACMMLDIPFTEGPYSIEYIENLIYKLGEMGPRMVVLTGVYFEHGVLGAACLDKDSGKISYYMNKQIQGSYHGTGDVFASALVAAVVRGIPLEKAMRIAVDFTVESIDRTFKAQTDMRFGVNFEQSIPNMLKAMDI